MGTFPKNITFYTFFFFFEGGRTNLTMKNVMESLEEGFPKSSCDQQRKKAVIG